MPFLGGQSSQVLDHGVDIQPKAFREMLALAELGHRSGGRHRRRTATALKPAIIDHPAFDLQVKMSDVPAHRVFDSGTVARLRQDSPVGQIANQPAYLFAVQRKLSISIKR